MALGFLNAGFKVKWACDFDKHCVKTYSHNVGDWVVEADVTKLKYSDVPKADGWAFGFPCQDLSVAGKQAGMQFRCHDCGNEWKHESEKQEVVSCPNCGSKHFSAATRSACFFEIMRLLDETRINSPENYPSFLLAENVKGLRPYIPTLTEELNSRGYEVYIQMYNSKYWGVPQNRERYFIVAIRKGIGEFSFPEEQHKFVPKLSSALDIEVDEKYYIPDEKAHTIIKQALQRLEELGKIHPCITPDRIKKRQNGRRAKEDEESMFTLTAQDIHGVIVEKEDDAVIIQTPRGKNLGNVHEVAPTPTANAYQENNFVCEKQSDVETMICEESGLLDPNGQGKTLRVGGGGVADKETQLSAHFDSAVRAGITKKQRNGKGTFLGISPTLLSTDYKGPHLLIEIKEE